MNKKGFLGGLAFALMCVVVFAFVAICYESQNFREDCESVASKSYGGEYDCNVGKLLDRLLDECTCQEKILIEGGYELGHEKSFKLDEDK